MAERQDNEIEEADQIYLLMKEEYRISRNVRLAWFLGKLNQVIRPTSNSELLHSENELDLLSVLPKGWQPDQPPTARPCMLIPSTRAMFLARRYRFVIELDLSPSTGIVDDSAGKLIFDEVFNALSKCLAGLARPFRVPGTSQVFQPKVFITILAYSSIIGLSSHQVLVQCCQLDCTDLTQFLQKVYHQLRAVENNIAEFLQQQHEQSERPLLSSSLDGCKLDSQFHQKQGITMVPADIGLVSMVRQGILALQLLPPNSSAGIIIITDGVTSVPDVAVCETLLNQLRSGTIACSFVQVGGTYSYDCSFGYVPNVELMKFISLASFGSYLASCPEVDVDSLEMNSYHKALLSYSFLKTTESMFSEYFCVSQHKLFNEHLVSTSGNPALVMRRKKHTEKEVHAHLISVVSVRLREGYTIREINLTKGGSQLEVKLVLLWKHNMSIEYLAAAAWPLDPDLRNTRVEVIMEGSYDILHDISCTQKKPITSPYRTSVIRRFWNTLQSINQTDQMLVHLQAFNSLPENYMIPESTKNGVPLFYIPPGSTTPVLSLQHSGSKDSSRSLFSSYWKPILSMDANFWQRWLHMHRISIILEHDMPLPKHVHTPGNNGRFSTIQCRISHSALTSLLKDWTSFVLVEGYSYIKVIYSSPEHPPSSFYLVRLISKTPCMVLRLGFPIGTLAHIRNKIVDELRDQILKLRFPHRVQNIKEVTPKTKRKLPGQPSPSKSPSLPVPKLALSDRPCVVVLNKPLERLLIRYDKLPLDFQVPFMFNMENPAHVPNTGTPLNVAASRSASSTLASLSRYFYHRRWVWAMQRNQGPVVSIQAMGHILSILSEIRLSEGFHFAASGEGIVNMVLELPMKGTSLDLDKESHSCMVQYILFPPHSNATKDSFSTDDDNDTEVEAIDADVELNLVTECWVEPQTGTVLSHTDQHHQYHGLKYQEIPQAIFPKDLSCMSTMLTFEYLSQMCQNKDQMQPIVADLHDGEGEFLASEDRILTVPFQFDLIQLLPKCQQIEMFFLMFGKVENEDANQGLSFLPNDMLLSLFHSSLEQDLSDREILLADSDHLLFIQNILEREREGHVAPFSLPILKEEYLGTPDRQDTTMSFHTISSSQEVTGSTSTLQSFSNVDLVDEEPVQPGRRYAAPQWRCYAKYISSQQIFLTFLPTALTDVVMLMSSEAGAEAEGDVDVTQTNDSLHDSVGGAQAEALSFYLSRGEQSDCSRGASPGLEGEGPTPDCLTLHQDSRERRRSETETPRPQSGQESRVRLAFPEKEGVQFREPQVSDVSPPSQQRPAHGGHLRCPVYVYHVSLDHLKDQLVHPTSSRQSRDVFMRSLSQERSSMSSWTDSLTQSHKHKELANYCSLLQEHYHQSYVKGVYRSLQQSYNICSQDLLTAMDYCEESLQEIDITPFLQTLCGHVRDFQESADIQSEEIPGNSTRSPMLVIGETEEDGTSSFSPSVEVTKGKEPWEESSTEPASPAILEENRTNKSQDLLLSLLRTQHTCEVHPELNKIIQDKFTEIGSQYFKMVPLSPHYFFYCPPSSKNEKDSDGDERRPSEELMSEPDPVTEDENLSGCCIVTESDTDLEVEYQEGGAAKSDGGEGDDRSLSDSDTVNQDEDEDDSFSILDADSLLEPEATSQEMPPLFVHLTCSVNLKSCHGSKPIQTLPTCLAEVLSCLDNAESLQIVDLNELSVTLDIFVLTLPPEIEVMADFHHNRYTSESSVSLNRSPGQPSSYRSDEEMMCGLDDLRGTNVNGVTGDSLSKLPMQQKLALLATMEEIRWLLEDEIVSALRCSQAISSTVLQKVADHVVRSSGRMCCQHEMVPLQFVFGPEQSLEKFRQEFRRISFHGYVLNGEQDSFHYMSLSRRALAGKTKADHALDLRRQLDLCAIRVNAGDKSGCSQASLGKVPENEKSVGATEADSEGEEMKPSNTDCSLPSGSSTDGVKVVKQQSEGFHSQNSSTKSPISLNLLPGPVSAEQGSEPSSLPKTPSTVSLTESLQSATHCSGKLRTNRVQSVVSSQGSLDSDMLGYDGDSSDSESESPALDEQEPKVLLMPNFWLIVRIHQDRVEVYSHSRSFTEDKDELEKPADLPEYLKLHQMMVRKISDMCRVVNQRMLLQDLHDRHVCNSLLVAESEDDIWKNDSLYRHRHAISDDYTTEENYQPRDYLAATMEFIPGYFACEVVWSTIILIHPRLKIGPNMGVSRAIQALRSVLNSFCVGNRKNMFVYQERTTKSVFYLRLSETSQAGKYCEMEGNLSASRSLGLSRSQEPSEEMNYQRSPMESSRPIGLVDKHILLLVHGVGDAGPEITDELVKLLRKRLNETTLDIITVMLVRNCKLTPADVEFIQPLGSPSNEVMQFSLPQYCLSILPAVAHYLRQNLLIFLHVPKYTDSNTAHHFKHYFHACSGLPDGDIYLYNKPGGQGTGGKGIACITLSFVDAQGGTVVVPAQDCTALQKQNPFNTPLHPDQFEELTAVFKMDSSNSLSVPQMQVRFDVWEQGNISPLQLGVKLQGALRHALCDVVMELNLLPNPLCLGAFCAAPIVHKEESKVFSPSPETKELKETHRISARVSKNSPSPIILPQAQGGTPTPGSSTPESTTPTSKSGRRSFWEMLGKAESSELVSPKTTDDIVPEKVEEGKVVRRRHKTESVKQQWSQERAGAVELEQLQRKQVSQLEEGDLGTLHPVYQFICQPWMTFMAQLGCTSVQQCTAEIASHFLLPSVLMEIVNLVSSLANDTTVKVFEKQSRSQSTDVFVPLPLVQHSRPASSNPRTFILVGRNFHQWHCSTDQEQSSDEEHSPLLNRFTPHKGLQRFEALEPADWPGPGTAHGGVAPRQRFLFIAVQGKKVTLHCYNWHVDLGSDLNRRLGQLFKWQNARAHVVHCLLNQKMGLFHHYCFSDTPSHDDSKQEPNPFLNPAVEPDALLRSPVPPVTSKDPGRLGSSGRSLAPLHFPSELLPFDEALRDMSTVRPFAVGEQDCPDVVTRHGNQLLEVKAAERREMEKQMKIENLFVTWQQRSAQSNMPISAVDLDILKQSSRLVHYCATPLLFDPAFRRQIQDEQFNRPPAKKRHCSSDSAASGRDRSYSTDSADTIPSRLKEESWLLELSNTFLQQYIQYLQSTGFILVQIRPQSPARNSVARARAAMLSSMLPEGRMSFSYVKQKSEDSPKQITASGTTPYHLQRALPGGIVLIELTFQGCYFCVKQYALECTRIPMGQTVNSQGTFLTKPRCKPFPEAIPVSDSALSMLFTEECDKVRDLMHVHSFSYDYHLRVVHQHLVGCHMMLRQGYQLTHFLEDFISHHPDIPKFGRNHVFQGSFSVSTGMITAHQLYNYITDHANTYSMKPVRMSKTACTADGKKGGPSAEQHEYALVALWNSSGSYKDPEGLQHYDDFDVSLLVCHNAAPFEEQLEGDRHVLKLRFYVIMTSQRELFPRLTADMRRFKKLPPLLHRDPADPSASSNSRSLEPAELGGGGGGGGAKDTECDPWEEHRAATAASPEASESTAPVGILASLIGDARGLLYPFAPFPLLNSEVLAAEHHIQASVEQAMGHCRRDTLWRRLFHGEQLDLVLDKLKLTKLSFCELEELLETVVSRSIGEIDPQLDCFLTMSPGWYQSLIKVLLSRFPQSCRHFDENGIQYLAVLNQKFIDCFVLVFLDTQAGKTSLKVVFREPLPSQPQGSTSPPPQLVSMYHHLESVINTACYTLWTGLL
ncbi:KICSTOR complex protein SZT2 isoform X3 [Gadus chalcogrammus]|uniref:KICSTOR complex protein SZT2 isoform X3 n=1 Tax=Gadus chalcogrammus TaxID=1042646 RepID=UPI0024C495F6|nr:KICSTOR complex protein SZT2 isoform X3 [Gadus chalcogrammus]